MQCDTMPRPRAPTKYVRHLSAHFEMRSFCPEVGIGLGVPPPPTHLVGDEHTIRALDAETHEHDVTSELRAYADTVLSIAPELCGYILVKGSPSCGYERVKRYDINRNPVVSD